MNGNVERIQRRLKESTDMMCMVHDEYHADESFANGAQWEDPQKRKNMGRTVEVFNRVPNLVNGVVNVVKQAPPAIKIIPLGEGAEQEYASIVASRIRAVEQQCSASKSRMHALKCAVKGGIGVWKTLPKSVKGQVRSVSQAIKDPTTVFPDAFSKEIDFSDAKWMIEKNKASCFGIMAAYPDSEYANHTIKGDEDKMVDILEEWEIVGDDDLVRTPVQLGVGPVQELVRDDAVEPEQQEEDVDRGHHRLAPRELVAHLAAGGDHPERDQEEHEHRDRRDVADADDLGGVEPATGCTVGDPHEDRGDDRQGEERGDDEAVRLSRHRHDLQTGRLL